MPHNLKRKKKSTIPDDWVAIKGDTYPVRDLLSAQGARWDGTTWRIDPDKQAAAQGIVDAEAAERRDADAALRAACAEQQRAEEAARQAAYVAKAQATARIVAAMQEVIEWQWVESKQVAGVSGGPAAVSVKFADEPAVDVTVYCNRETRLKSGRVTIHRTCVPVMPGYLVTVRYWDNRERIKRIEALIPAQS